MNWRDEDPAHDAGHKIAQMITVSAVMAACFAQMQQVRSLRRVEEEARRAALAVETAEAEMRERMRQAEDAAAQIQVAREENLARWEKLRDPSTRESTTLQDAMACWIGAHTFSDDPHASETQDLAEERLRRLRPDVMERYDQLREQGVDDVSAMRDVAADFDREPVWVRPSAPQRAALGNTKIHEVVQPPDLVVAPTTAVATHSPTASQAVAVATKLAPTSTVSDHIPNLPVLAKQITIFAAAPALTLATSTTPTIERGLS